MTLTDWDSYKNLKVPLGLVFAVMSLAWIGLTYAKETFVEKNEYRIAQIEQSEAIKGLRSEDQK